MPLMTSTDWHRHRKECTSAQTKMDNNLSNTSNNMVVSPSSPKKQLTAVSALLFSPEEGELDVGALIYL